jgi:hypothetical protein
MFCRQHACQLCLYVLLLQRPFAGRGLFCTVVCTFARMNTHAGVSVGLRYQARGTHWFVAVLCAADGPAATVISSCAFGQRRLSEGWQQPNRCCIKHMLHTTERHTTQLPSAELEQRRGFLWRAALQAALLLPSATCRMRGPGQLNAGGSGSRPYRQRRSWGCVYCCHAGSGSLWPPASFWG